MLDCELLYVASLDKSAATIGKHLIFLRHASDVSLLASAACTQKYIRQPANAGPATAKKVSSERVCGCRKWTVFVGSDRIHLAKTASCAIKHNSHSRNFAFSIGHFPISASTRAPGRSHAGGVGRFILGCVLPGLKSRRPAGEAIIFCLSPDVSNADTPPLEKKTLAADVRVLFVRSNNIKYQSIAKAVATFSASVCCYMPHHASCRLPAPS